MFETKKSPTGPTFHGPKTTWVSNSSITWLRGPLGFGPIQFLMVWNHHPVGFPQHILSTAARPWGHKASSAYQDGLSDGLSSCRLWISICTYMYLYIYIYDYIFFIYMDLIPQKNNVHLSIASKVWELSKIRRLEHASQHVLLGTSI